MREDLTVSRAAEILGTSPQTVRALLRKGELRGQRKAWGARYVWEVSGEGLDEFLAEYGRLDGHRRQSRPSPAAPDSLEALLAASSPDPVPSRSRARRVAAVVAVVLGLPLLVAYAVARVLPDALWFQEVGHTEVFGRVVEARVLLYLAVSVPIALVVGANLALALRGTRVASTRSGVLSVTGVAVATGSLFATARRPLADAPALAASADLRSTRSDPRQGRRLLRLHTALRARPVGPPRLGGRRLRGLRAGDRRRPRAARSQAAPCRVRGSGPPGRPGGRLPPRGRVADRPAAVPARGGPTGRSGGQHLRRRWIRGRHRPRPRPDVPRAGHRRDRRALPRSPVRRPGRTPTPGSEARPRPRDPPGRRDAAPGHPDPGGRAAVRRRPQPAAE